MRRRSVVVFSLSLLMARLCLAGDSCAAREWDGVNGEARAVEPAFRVVRRIEVTDSPKAYTWPVWSPDGMKLAFTGSNKKGTYVRNADGTGLIREVLSSDQWYCPVWSKDSRSLVVERGRSGRYDLIDIETGEVTSVDSREPFVGGFERNIHGLTAYYPDDEPPPPDVRLKIDFRNRRMWVIETDGDSDRMTEFPHGISLAFLSPRRDLVIYKPGNGNMYVSGLDGSSVVNLGRGDMLDWSQDGKRLVYLSDCRQTHYTVIGYNIFVINADGSGKTRLMDTPDLVEHYPTWSPDGTRVAYSTHRPGKIYVAVMEEAK